MNTDKIFDLYGPYLDVLGRLLIAAIFLLSVLPQIQDFAGTQGFMESKGLPGILLPVVIALEIAGSFAVIAGWKVRIFSFLLAGYTLLAALFFHNNWSDPMHYYSFLKNLGMVGGLLFLTVNGVGKFSLAARKRPAA